MYCVVFTLKNIHQIVLPGLVGCTVFNVQRWLKIRVLAAFTLSAKKATFA